jgi:flagellar hook-basal body complex protein FliE
VDNPNSANDFTQKQARELVAQQRHHDEHLKDAMLNRAKADISISHDTTDTSATQA